MNKIKERRKAGAVCPTCKSPDYSYKGRVCEPDGKHQFECNSCKKYFQFGKNDSVYIQLK
jgi:transposase-like protein